MATAVAQEYRTQVLTNNIKTLRVRFSGSEVLERPVLSLAGDSQLEISFDQLSHTTHFYSYTLLHLNSDYTKSDLLVSDYLKGDISQQITDYDQSINTQQLYTHYRFLFPNDDMQPTVSGNYALKIYEDNDEQKVIGYVCFSVAEQLVSIEGKVRANTDIELNGRYQQLDIDITAHNINITNAADIRLVVAQNGRQDNSVRNPKPTFIEGNRYRFINNKSLIFEGGNEYRRFDIASQYVLGQNVDKINFDRTFYHAFLFPDEITADSPYLTELDADGQYVINAERADDDDYEADYMWVHFLLPRKAPWFDGGVYIAGDITYNRLNDNSRMQYDNEHAAYCKSLYLKQGAYSYIYLFKQKGYEAATSVRTEGSHWQTENEYQIYVYYRPFGSRGDRLIGYKTIKSN